MFTIAFDQVTWAIIHNATGRPPLPLHGLVRAARIYAAAAPLSRRFGSPFARRPVRVGKYGAEAKLFRDQFVYGVTYFGSVCRLFDAFYVAYARFAFDGDVSRFARARFRLVSILRVGTYALQVGQVSCRASA